MAALRQGAAQRIPRVGREAQLEGLDGAVREAALAKVVEGRLPGGVPRQDLVVEGDGRLECLAQALALGIFAGGALAELHPGTTGELPQRGREVRAVALHDEVEDVSPAAAPEAVPRLAPGSYDEAGRLLPVEGAEALEGGPRLAQRDALPDEFDDVKLLLDLGGSADGQVISWMLEWCRRRPA